MGIFEANNRHLKDGQLKYIYSSRFEMGVPFVRNINPLRVAPMISDLCILPGDGSREDPVYHLRRDGCKEKIQLILWMFIFKRQVRVKIWICSVTVTNRKSDAPSTVEISRLRRASNEPLLLVSTCTSTHITHARIDHERYVSPGRPCIHIHTHVRTHHTRTHTYRGHYAWPGRPC